jgi:hypothetical protein
VASSCKHDVEPSCSIKGGEFINWLSYFELRKNVCAPWSQCYIFFLEDLYVQLVEKGKFVLVL